MKKVKELWPLMHTLEAMGYTHESNGNFFSRGKANITADMFNFCGKEKPPIWTWEPEWLEEVEPKKRLMTRDEMMDFVSSDTRIRVRFSGESGNWRLVGWMDYTMLAHDYEYCIRENGEYGPVMQFEVEDEES